MKAIEKLKSALNEGKSPLEYEADFDKASKILAGYQIKLSRDKGIFVISGDYTKGAMRRVLLTVTNGVFSSVVNNKQSSPLGRIDLQTLRDHATVVAKILDQLAKIDKMLVVR